MFKKLRNRIIIITMVVTTAVLILSGTLIIVFSSATRPEPKPISDPKLGYNMPSPEQYNDQELKDFIRDDRKEGSERLLITLLCVGAVIEVAVFLIVYYSSQKIVEPVKDSYEKQKMFIANASHELKTPLAIIAANMEALDVDKNSKKWTDNIECEIEHANKLVLDLLQLAKMDAGSNGKTAPLKVDLEPEIKKRIDMFKPKFSGTISFDSKNKPNTMALPKQDVLQILDILLDNATKYGDKKVLVKLDKNRIMISNDGATISGEDAEKIFDRFYQTDKSRGGSGLGLAIAKALCKQNGWNIKCEKNKGKTVFTLVL